SATTVATKNNTAYSEADDSNIEIQSQESASSESGGEEGIGGRRSPNSGNRDN
ncbi:hypothetical protein L917_21376, partial [Phytophthora nicotianae]